jgi:hypothetical protein
MSARVSLTAAEAAQLGVVVASAWAGTLLPAPAALDPGARPWPTTIAVALLGLLLVAAQRRWPDSFDSARRSAWLSLACLVVGLGGGGLYVFFVESWTCPYYAESRIMGSELTPYAAEYLRQEPGTGCEELLKRFTGRADEIWTPASSLARELILSALHLAVLAALTLVALMATRLLLQRRRLPGGRRSATTLDRLDSGQTAGERLLPLALELSRVVLLHESIKSYATMALRCPELVAIPNPAHARALWLAVLQRAEIEGRIPRLVALVLDDNPAADELRALVREWSPAGLPGTLPETLVSHPR